MDNLAASTEYLTTKAIEYARARGMDLSADNVRVVIPLLDGQAYQLELSTDSKGDVQADISILKNTLVTPTIEMSLDLTSN